MVLSWLETKKRLITRCSMEIPSRDAGSTPLLEPPSERISSRMASKCRLPPLPKLF